MSNVYINTLGVPRKARNKRIYAGNTFETTNRYAAQQQITQRHIEAGRLTDLTSRNVVVYYTSPFTAIPTGAAMVTIYRMVEGSTMGFSAGTKIKQDVLHYYPDANALTALDSFSITIDSSEDLTGIILEYLIIE